MAVGKILQTIGWHSINSTPLEVLTDIFSSYIQQITKITNDYASEFGQTDANLDHLGLAFQEMGVNLSELEEYVTYVNFAPGAHPAPKFPVPKEDNLNFLKPGSKEVVTRPVYIHEHMPPMYPLLEGTEIKEEEVSPIKEESVEETHFKKPSDISSPEFRKLKREDEGSRPTREISSVMMTTSGFLSPAREGKLPEAKAPIPPPVVEPPPPPLAPTASNIDPNLKKKGEKRKEKFSKELFKPISEEKVVKKNATMKDVVKMKQKAAAAAAAAAAASTSHLPHPVPSVIQPHPVPPRLNELKLNSIPPQKMMRDNLDKALAAAKAKTEKLNTTITPIPMKSQSPVPQLNKQQVEKLFNEPDRKKINILRKISSVKEGKVKKDSRAGTPNLIIDEPSDIVNKISLSSDITIEPIPMMRSPGKMDHFFDNGSPPGTPPTPRTPEIITHSPPVPAPKEKRKRKEGTRNKVPRVRKPPRKNPHIPFFTESELVDMIMERPKTPDAHHLNHLRPQLPAHMNLPSMPPPHIPFPFLTNFGGPGLIPSQLTTPMFPFSHLGSMPNFGKNPYFPPVVPNLPPQVDPVPLLSPKVKEPPAPVEIKPVEIIPPKAPPPPPLQPIQVQETSSSTTSVPKTPVPQDLSPKKVKEHKKEKKDKIKKKNKKDKVKEKAEKKKIKELKKDGKVKREKKTKKKEKSDNDPVIPIENPAIPKILLKVNSPSPRPETPEGTRKLNIKPIVKKDDEPIIEDKKREPSPGGLARISALVTGPPKTKTTSSPLPPVEKVAPEEITPVAPPRTPGKSKLNPMKPKPPPKPKKVEQTFKKTDEQGNEVWICPACGQQDDGRPMIGCDGCDAWYHWVCVGIQVPPDENENWYCKPCLCRKNEDLQSDKKRKRKKKEKKEH
ncbi:hypothetical protein JTB14_007668 [Gonioctena quinquepunctata]|nr:hypothetical protein JTB14_007668 [Gonioctena quinquepunctata]